MVQEAATKKYANERENYFVPTSTSSLIQFMFLLLHKTRVDLVNFLLSGGDTYSENV